MSKKTDLKFDDVEIFMKEHPHFVVEKFVPAHTERSPNYAAIRAVLRSGKVIPGVLIVEAAPASSHAQEKAQETGKADSQEAKRSQGDKLAAGSKR